MFFSNFIKKINKLSENGGDIRVFNKALFEVSEKELFINFLDSIIRDDTVIDNIISQSYAHQNGFDKLVLATCNEKKWRLRLHIWDNYKDLDYEYDIHNHVWDYSSVIICGELINSTYINKNKGDLFHHHVYDIDDINCKASLKYLGVQKLSLNSKTIYDVRSVYSQNKKVIHRAYPNHRYTVTLIIQGEIDTKTSEVYKSRIDEYDKKIGLNNNLISKEYLLQKLFFLKESLNYG